MVRIQLENGFIDIKEGSNFPLNFASGDVRDLTQKKGSNSKTLTAIGSKNNHDLLNHYYDVNIVAGTFDINALTKCAVIQDGIPIMEDCYLQLLSVNKSQPNSNYEQQVEYQLMVKDATSDLFTKLDNKYLTDLDFSELDHVINASNVVATFTNTVTDGYKYLLPWSGDNVYPLKEMRPAIYVKRYFDSIFATNGFSYTWATSGAAKFDQLIIPYNGDLPILDYANYEVIASKVDTYTFPQAAGTNVSTVEPLDNLTEIQDNETIFNPTTGEYTVPFYVTGGETIMFNFNVDLEFSLNNTTAANAYLYSSSLLAQYRYYPTIEMYKNGVIYSTTPILGLGSYTRNASPSALPSGMTIFINDTFNASAPVSGLVPTDVITAKIGIRVESAGSPLWKDANSSGGTNVQVDMILDVNSLTMTVQPGTNIIGSGSTVEMARFIPKKIKQRDFVKGILSMFNLFVEIDKTAPNNLILQHRDDYYDSGNEVDWTKKLCKDIEQELIFLPDITSKKMILTYKADQDLPNTDYVGATNEIYGQVEYVFDTEYQKGIDTKEMIFSPTPVGRTTFGAYVPFIAGSAPKTNIRILVDGGTDTCSAYNIYDYGTTGQTGLTTYPLLGHFDDPLNPTFDLNFATCDFYYYDGVNVTNNNLYNKYWRRTVNQINTGKMLVAYFDLNEGDIQAMRLNDKIRIDNSWWNINKIIDYNANVKGFTKVELISIDSEIDFAPFKFKIPKLPVDSQVSHVTKTILQTSVDNNNVVMSGSDVMIKGRNNVVLSGTTGLIIGDDNIVTEKYVNITEGVAIGENFANTDLTFTGNRTHDFDGYSAIFGNAELLVTSNTGTTLTVYGNDTVPAMTLDNSNGGEIALSITNGLVEIGNIPEYRDNAQATSGGLAPNIVYQTADGVLRINDASVNFYKAINSTYTLQATDNVLDCTSGTFTLTLSTATNKQGQVFTIKNSGAGIITVDAFGTETIDGALTITLNQYDSYTIVSTGANWIII